MINLLIIFIGISFYEVSAQEHVLNASGVTVSIQKNWIVNLNKRGTLQKPLESVSNTDSNYLFKRYPSLAHKIPYKKLATLPTPLEKLSGFTNVYIKRDDLTAQSYGGNKIRKLEFLLGEALAYNAQEVITLGCTGSNHVLATAINCFSLALHPTGLLLPQPHSFAVRDNLLKHQELGTELHYFPDAQWRKIGLLSRWQESYQKTGHYPYVIPTGGSTPVGVLGYVNAALEFLEQVENGQGPYPDIIYVPCGSAGTVAGLLLGFTLGGFNDYLIKAIAVEPEDSKDAFLNTITSLYEDTLTLLRDRDQSINAFAFPQDRLIIDSNHCGTGYGIFTDEGIKAKKLFKDSEHIDLEGTYTGKTVAALLHDLTTQPELAEKTLLYWHTYSGKVASKYSNADNIDFWLTEYLEGDIQPLDIL